MLDLLYQLAYRLARLGTAFLLFAATVFTMALATGGLFLMAALGSGLLLLNASGLFYPEKFREDLNFNARNYGTDRPYPWPVALGGGIRFYFEVLFFSSLGATPFLRNGGGEKTRADDVHGGASASEDRTSESGSSGAHSEGNER